MSNWQGWRSDPHRPENAPARGRTKLAGDAASDARRELRLRGQKPERREDLSWMGRGACRGVDPDVMVPKRGDVLGEQIARETCAGCPVAGECLAYALVHVEARGVWGGTSGRDRRRMRAERSAA